jgi:tRNA pseudouridine55 synthase
VNGVLLVAKSSGPTSHDLVALVRRLTGVRRVGHGGTLDPFATGVLPVFIGQATRLAEYHLGDEKEYQAQVSFGARSTTDDLEGELTPTGVPPTREQVVAALADFLGEQEQVPPAYSAVHVAGRRAYELARHGATPELRPRRVTISRLELLEWDPSFAERPVATIELRCSAGTYVRALARDLGERLGGGAYLTGLTRTASGPFRLADAHSEQEVRRAATDNRLAELLLPPDAGLDAYPRITLGDAEIGSLARGQQVGAPPNAGEGLIRIVDGAGRLAAIASRRHGRLQPEKVFLPPGG